MKNINFIYFFSIGILFGQSWITIGNYETIYAHYYLGISEPNLPQAESINNAFSNALEKAGIEQSMVNIESIRKINTTTGINRRIDKRGITNSGQLKSTTESGINRQFSSSIDNITLMEELYDGDIGYTLIRIPKEGYNDFDFFSMNREFNISKKINGIKKSAMVPGLGSYYQEKPARGTLFLLGSIASAGMILSSYSKYNKAIDQMNTSILSDDLLRFYDESIIQSNRFSISLLSFSTIYIMNLLDPFLFPGEFKDYYYRKKQKPRNDLKIIKKSNWNYNDLGGFGFVAPNRIPIEASSNSKFENSDEALKLSGGNIYFSVFFENIKGMIYYAEHITGNDHLLFKEGGIGYYKNYINSIFGLYPLIGASLGYCSVSQDWDDKDEFLTENYDKGFGFKSKNISSYYLQAKIEAGLQKWFNQYNIFLNFGYHLPARMNNFNIKVYDGTEIEGMKNAVTKRITPSELPYSNIKIGGKYISLGISYNFKSEAK